MRPVYICASGGSETAPIHDSHRVSPSTVSFCYSRAVIMHMYLSKTYFTCFSPYFLPSWSELVVVSHLLVLPGLGLRRPECRNETLEGFPRKASLLLSVCRVRLQKPDLSPHHLDQRKVFRMCPVKIKKRILSRATSHAGCDNMFSSSDFGRTSI